MTRREERKLTGTIIAVASVLFVCWLALCWIDHNYPLAAAHCAERAC